MLSRKCQTAKQELCTGRGLSASPPCLLSHWLAQLARWALIGRQETAWARIGWRATARAVIGRQGPLRESRQGWAAPWAPAGFSCFLLPVAVWESTAEVFLSLPIKGPWLYGDGEARTEYVQNDFYKQGWKTPVWCRVLLARAIHRKLRFPLVLRRQLSFLVQGLKKRGSWLSSSSSPPLHSSFTDTCWGYIRSWKAFLHHPTLRLVPTEMNEERCSGYSRSREQWGTSETNPLGTLKQIKNQHRFQPWQLQAADINPAVLELLLTYPTIRVLHLFLFLSCTVLPWVPAVSKRQEVAIGALLAVTIENVVCCIFHLFYRHVAGVCELLGCDLNELWILSKLHQSFRNQDLREQAGNQNTKTRVSTPAASTLPHLQHTPLCCCFPLPFTLPSPVLGEGLSCCCCPAFRAPFPAVPQVPPCPRFLLTASTRLLALPWSCRLLPALGLGTVRDTGRALRGLPPLSGYREPQCTDGRLLLSFSEDSAPSRRSVGMVCCGQPRLQGVAGGVAHSRENVVGEWLRWSRGLRPATANACGHRRDNVSDGLEQGGAGETIKAWRVWRLVKTAASSLKRFDVCCKLILQAFL